MSEAVDAVAWGRKLADLHAAMHAQIADRSPSQRARLRRIIRQGKGLHAESKQDVLTVLESLPDGQAVCHRDFHPGNVILARNAPVVIDWIDATIGHPLGDIARTIVLLTSGRPPPLDPVSESRLESRRGAFRRAYEARYAELRPLPRDDLERWMAVSAGAARRSDPGGARRPPSHGGFRSMRTASCHSWEECRLSIRGSISRARRLSPCRTTSAW